MQSMVSVSSCESQYLPVPCIKYGPEGDGMSKVCLLFKALRELAINGALTVCVRYYITLN